MQLPGSMLPLTPTRTSATTRDMARVARAFHWSHARTTARRRPGAKTINGQTKSRCPRPITSTRYAKYSTKKQRLRRDRPGRVVWGGGPGCAALALPVELSSFTWRSPMVSRVEAQTSLNVSDYDFSSFYYSSSDD